MPLRYFPSLFSEAFASADLADVVDELFLICGEAVPEEDRIPVSDIDVDTTIDTVNGVKLHGEVMLSEHCGEIKLTTPDYRDTKYPFHVPCTTSAEHVVH